MIIQIPNTEHAKTKWHKNQANLITATFLKNYDLGGGYSYTRVYKFFQKSSSKSHLKIQMPERRPNQSSLLMPYKYEALPYKI